MADSYKLGFEDGKAYGQACIDTLTRPAAGEYDRELIACMLQDFRRGRLDTYKTEYVEEQIALLREADNRDAAGVHTANLSAAPQQSGQEVRTCMNPCTYSDFFNGRACEKCLATVFSPTGVSTQQPAEAVAVELPDVSDAEIAAWLERHDLSHAIRGTDARAAFEDAQSFVLTKPATPPPAIDTGKLWELVERLHSEAGNERRDGNHGAYGGMSYCADQLAALIGGGGEKANG